MYPRQLLGGLRGYTAPQLYKRKGRVDENPPVLSASTAQGGDEQLGSGVGGDWALSGVTCTQILPSHSELV